MAAKGPPGPLSGHAACGSRTCSLWTFFSVSATRSVWHLVRVRPDSEVQRVPGFAPHLGQAILHTFLIFAFIIPYHRAQWSMCGQAFDLACAAKFREQPGRRQFDPVLVSSGPSSAGVKNLRQFSALLGVH
jgi:hypothetical protein